MKCPVNSRNDLKVIKTIIQSLLSKLDDKFKSDIKYSLPMVHYVFETIKEKFEIYLRFTQFEPAINSSDLLTSKEYYSLESSCHNCLYIHLDSCLECIQLFKKNFQHQSWIDCISLNKLYALLQLISQILLNSNESDQVSQEKLRKINEQFESLTVLQLFMDNIPKYDFEGMYFLFRILSTLCPKKSFRIPSFSDPLIFHIKFLHLTHLGQKRC